MATHIQCAEDVAGLGRSPRVMLCGEALVGRLGSDSGETPFGFTKQPVRAAVRRRGGSLLPGTASESGDASEYILYIDNDVVDALKAKKVTSVYTYHDQVLDYLLKRNRDCILFTACSSGGGPLIVESWVMTANALVRHDQRRLPELDSGDFEQQFAELVLQLTGLEEFETHQVLFAEPLPRIEIAGVDPIRVSDPAEKGLRFHPLDLGYSLSSRKDYVLPAMALAVGMGGYGAAYALGLGPLNSAKNSFEAEVAPIKAQYEAGQDSLNRLRSQQTFLAKLERKKDLIGPSQKIAVALAHQPGLVAKSVETSAESDLDPVSFEVLFELPRQPGASAVEGAEEVFSNLASRLNAGIRLVNHRENSRERRVEYLVRGRFNK
ncbi:hypothetical protein RM531_09140 [Salinisphaera sp. P385]|uniref:Uncharacterized protein n=1 Tax=Spectribacter acetivorans TaxID=3075603 RepID=A0ABU3B840_9GAMM|nr:hypothetical protein [Salinisphaera sp. P385]MDT0618642.1 hypothetical protein [Salinisphaera sp. P385]